jgi:hypothetical protein
VLGAPVEWIDAEIRLCQLLCENCHRKRTKEQHLNHQLPRRLRNWPLERLRRHARYPDLPPVSWTEVDRVFLCLLEELVEILPLDAARTNPLATAARYAALLCEHATDPRRPVEEVAAQHKIAFDTAYRLILRSGGRATAYLLPSVGSRTRSGTATQYNNGAGKGDDRLRKSLAVLVALVRSADPALRVDGRRPNGLLFAFFQEAGGVCNKSAMYARARPLGLNVREGHEATAAWAVTEKGLRAAALARGLLGLLGR